MTKIEDRTQRSVPLRQRAKIQALLPREGPACRERCLAQAAAERLAATAHHHHATTMLIAIFAVNW